MIRYILTAVALFALTACTRGEEINRAAWEHGSAELCIDGVAYLQFPAGTTLMKYRRDGTIAGCE